MPLPPIPRPKTPRVGRPVGKFTQHRRIDHLRAQLETHAAGLTLEQLADLLRMTTRSVRRYLRELALVTELESVAVRPGGAHLWRIKPSERGRAVLLRRTQAYALLAARRVYEVLRGSALFDEIDVALRLVEQIARRPAVRPGPRAEGGGETRLEERFAYLPPPARAYANRSEEVDALFQAVAELTVLRFRYREESSDGKSVRVTVQPYALVLHGGTIVCIGRDVGASGAAHSNVGASGAAPSTVDRAHVRAFAFDRMSELQASEGAEGDHRFELPDDFDLADWMHGDFGVGHAPHTLRLLVEFDPRVADAVRGRRVHPSQKLAVAADGRVRASLTVPSSPEVLAQVRSWVLGFGAAARVLEPRELAEELGLELRRAAARYAE
jgi:predicted DNA-binding transcriptional regulator YafY